MMETTAGDTLQQFVTAPVRTATYKRLLYLLLAFPLGVAYFVAFTTGSSLGLGLAFTLVGLPVLLVTLVATTGAAGLEARLATVLLDQEVATPPSPRETLDSDDGYLAAVWRFATEPTTWASVAVVLLKFVYGIVAFVVTITGTALVGTLLAAPFVYDDPGANYQFGQYAVSTLPEAIGVAAVGVAGIWILCNVINVVAAAGGLMTDAFLSVGRERAA